MNKKFWNFINNNNSTAELTLYGSISDYSWWDDEVTPKQFKNELEALGDKEEIVVRINSGGGDVFAAHAIFTNLKDNKAKITVKIDGLAASAATIVAMAGDKILIPSSAYMMIHDPLTHAFGQAKDFRKMADTLDVIKDGLMNAYRDRTGKNKEELAAIMAEETWLTGEQAVEQGFADELMFSPIAIEPGINNSMVFINSVQHDLSQFKNRPQLNAKASDGINQINKKGDKNSMEIKNAVDLKTHNTEIYNEVFQAGVTAEANRIKAIDELAGKVDSEFLNQCKYQANMTAEQVALNALKEGKMLNTSYINNIMADAASANQVSGDATPTITGDEDASILASIQAIAQKTLKGGK